MHPFVRLIGIMGVFFLATVGWLILGAVTGSRTNDQRGALEGRVADLWGNPETQAAPSFELHWAEQETKTEQVIDATGHTTTKKTVESVPHVQAVDPIRSRIAVDLHLDQRRKGLLWFPLYDVAFRGAWTYRYTEELARDLRVALTLPDKAGVYDDFHFIVDGVDLAPRLRPTDGVVATFLPVKTGQTVVLEVSYRSRGRQEWIYRPTHQVGQVEDFTLTMTTDFRDIDFPKLTMSPSQTNAKGKGYELQWAFSRLVSGYGIGMTMPAHVQPGELAAQMSFSAPISLGLFLVFIYVITLLRRIELHPMNFLFVAAAFFSYNLLFGYTADRLPVEMAFVLSSAVSVGLVTSYLRLVVGPRFAWIEAGPAQLVYQVGFSLAHFYEGYTGLSITVLVIITLFVLMQLTGRLSWGAAFARAKIPASELWTPRDAAR
jgi:inner membrane protein involved in colicin E2 resistance